MPDSKPRPRSGSAKRTNAVPHPGLRLKEWTLTKRLDGGKGGNGVVWEVASDRSGQYVMKFLNAKGRPDAAYRLARFADETKFLRDNPDLPGIVPLVDSSVSTDPAALNWYVMPRAVPLMEALGTDPTIETVLGAVAAYAETLANLAERRIGHRDIKPDNLFWLLEQWALGDFGLVTYPEKDPRTDHGRRLGPIDYMAPEMRSDADNAGAEPADVYALAKTLWVLLTGQDLPLPGAHRSDDEACTLRNRITYRFVNELDLLLERATQTDPTKRIAMREFALELRACLADPPESLPQPDLEALQRRVQSLAGPQVQRNLAAQERRVRANKAFYELQAIQSAALNQLTHLLGFNGRIGQQETLIAGRLLGMPQNTPYAGYGAGGMLFSPDQPGRVRILVEAAMRVQEESSSAEIAAAIAVEHHFDGRSDVKHVWQATYVVPIGSAQFANALREIEVGFAGSASETLQQTILILNQPEGEEPAWFTATRPCNAAPPREQAPCEVADVASV